MDLSQPSKRLVIRKFKHRTASNGLNFDSKWRLIEDSVQKIQREQRTSVSFEELYSIVENLCLNNYSGEIHSRLQQLIRCYAEDEARRLSVAQHANSQHLLRSLNEIWEKFCAQMAMIRSVFLFLDRTYRVQNATIISLWDAGLEAFRQYFFGNLLIKSPAIKGLLDMIETERSGTPVDRQLLKSLMRMLINLQIYDEMFEPEFLQETQRMYTAEGRKHSQELDIDLYMRHVERRIHEEEERLNYYLEYSTSRKLMPVVDQCFILAHVDTIISKGIEPLLEHNRTSELSLMYSLLSRVKSGPVALKDAFYNWTSKTGRAMVLDTSRDSSLVQDLMDFKSRLDEIVSKCFNNNEKFIQAEKDAFSYFICSPTNTRKLAELIAKYMDSRLRKGNKELTEEALDAVMNRVIVLFRFVQGKDVFEAYYKRDLARRLLLGRSASYDSEKAMLVKLKTECGGAFTQRLDRMFQDVEVSRTLMERFNERFPRRRETMPIDFNVMTLSKCLWPFEELVEFEIPSLLRSSFQQFTQFYGEIYSGRKLELILTKSNGELYCNVFSRKYTLIVSTVQISVLLLFNDRLEYSVEQMAQLVKLDVNRIIPNLYPLIKSHLLVPCNEEESAPDGDSSAATSIGAKSILRLNDSFTNKKTKIDLSRIGEHRKQEDADKEESEEVQRALAADRKYTIEATIVRIMKMRKTLKHQELMREVSVQLSNRFTPTVPQIKVCVDRLLDQFYIKRSENDRETYEYQA